MLQYFPDIRWGGAASLNLAARHVGKEVSLMVTFGDLFQYTLVLCGVFGVAVAIFSRRK